MITTLLVMAGVCFLTGMIILSMGAKKRWHCFFTSFFMTSAILLFGKYEYRGGQIDVHNNKNHMYLQSQNSGEKVWIYSTECTQPNN